MDEIPVWDPTLENSIDIIPTINSDDIVAAAVDVCSENFVENTAVDIDENNVDAIVIGAEKDGGGELINNSNLFNCLKERDDSLIFILFFRFTY